MERQRRIEERAQQEAEWRLQRESDLYARNMSVDDSYTEWLLNSVVKGWAKAEKPKSKYLFDTVDQVLDSQETAIFELNREIEGLKLLVQTMREREEERLRDSWTS